MSQSYVHSNDRILLLAEERIGSSDDTNNNSLEYEVGAWLCTMLARYFQEDFLIMPESVNKQTNKKPDFAIERYDEENSNTTLHLVCEIKRARGDHLEQALDQVIKAIRFTGDETNQHETFVIIQRGWKIGFFEFFTFFHGDLDDKEIDHFRGCVPLLFQSTNMTRGEGPHCLDIENMRGDNIPRGVDRLLTRPTRKEPNELLDDADSLQTPCIFDIKVHKREIDLIFRHLATGKPRSINITWKVYKDIWGKRKSKENYVVKPHEYNFQQLYLTRNLIVHIHLRLSIHK